MNSNRLEYIDRLKGFAILCVVMGHYVILALKQKDIVGEVIGSFHMPLFMFLSGFVISSPPSLSKSCKKAIAFMLPMIVIGIIFVFFSGSTISVWLNSPFKHGYWYLYVLSLFYLLLSFVGRVKNNAFQILMAIVVFVIICLLTIILPKQWNDIFSIWILKQYWPFFIVAYFARKMHLTDILIRKNIFYSISLIGYVIGFIFYIHGYSHLFYLNAFFFIAAIFYGAMMTGMVNNVITKSLSYLGKHTFDIYVFHFFIIHLTSLGKLGQWFVDSDNVLLEVLSGILYSVIVAPLCIFIGKILRLSNLINAIVFGSFIKKRRYA